MISKLQITFALLVATAAFISSAQGLQLAFSGRNLPNRDPFNGAPDGYINVYYAPNPQTPYVFLGRTDDISDNRNPDWPELFTFTYNGGTAQRLKIDLYDADWPDADDYMGMIEFTLSEISSAFGGIIERDLIGGNPEEGYLIVKLATPKEGQKVIDADEVMKQREKLQEVVEKVFVDPRLRNQAPPAAVEAPALVPVSAPAAPTQQ